MKKNILVMMAAALVLTACEKEIPGSGEVAEVTFAVNGSFGDASFEGGGATRGTLSADGKDMTDLWVFDIVGGDYVQTVHQSGDDDDFGEPTLSLSYGLHRMCFVASRGGSPVVDTDAGTIRWGTVRDTFYKVVEVNVTGSTGGQSVTLDRVATKLRLAVDDEVPSGCASLTVVPGRWYDGLNYENGAVLLAQDAASTVSVPSSYIGTSGELAVSVFGLSSTTEWTTTVSLTARNGSNTVLGTATISDVPMKRNRVTEYHGTLFSGGGASSVALDAEWDDSYTGEW